MNAREVASKIARNSLKNAVMGIGFKQTSNWETMLADLEGELTETITSTLEAYADSKLEEAAQVADEQSRIAPMPSWQGCANIIGSGIRSLKSKKGEA